MPIYCSCGAEFHNLADLKEHAAESGGLTHGDCAGPPTAVRTAPAAKFPITIRLLRCRDGHELWSRTITLVEARRLEPIEVPGYGGTEHAPVMARIEYADGTIEEHAPQ